MKTTTIRSIAHALPAKVLTYEELAARFGEREVASIAKMSGIRNRRVVAPGQCASDLAVAAAKRLLEHTKIDPLSIDALIFCSQTPDYRTPATACRLQNILGLPERCSSFDMNQACAAFIYSMQVAHSMVAAGTVSRALVLNADAITTYVNPLDRGLATLHGDAAVATLVESCDDSKGGIEFFDFGTSGKDYDRLIVKAGAARTPHSDETAKETIDADGNHRSAEQLYMDGPAVFHFVLNKVKAFLKELLAKRGLTINDFDTVLFHQANRTMVDLLYRSVGVPKDKQFYYMENVGNSAGATTPCLLAEAWREGVVKPGSRTLVCAFGGGLSWGAFSIRWPKDADASVPGDVDVPG
jgi:3-oxoacyl-[acyl-carrier-protein] synthase III